MNPSSRFLIPVIIAASSVAASAAVTTTQTFSIINQTLDISNKTSPVFYKFNASTGRTLTEVKITYSLTFNSGELIIDNDGESIVTPTITGSLTGILNQGTGGITFTGLNLTDSFEENPTLQPDNGDGAAIDGSPDDGAIFSLAGLTDTQFVTVANVNPYVGTGTEQFTFKYYALRGFDIINADAAAGGFTASRVDGYISVSYFSTIPEVFSSLATASVLLLGFVGYRPRRDAQAT
jgi:hypothetical protein